MTKLRSVQEKRSLQHTKDLVAHNLQLLDDMKTNTEVDNGSLSDEAKRRKKPNASKNEDGKAQTCI